MSDLSDFLGNVYGGDDDDADAAEPPQRGGVDTSGATGAREHSVTEDDRPAQPSLDDVRESMEALLAEADQRLTEEPTWAETVQASEVDEADEIAERDPAVEIDEADEIAEGDPAVEIAEAVDDSPDPATGQDEQVDDWFASLEAIAEEADGPADAPPADVPDPPDVTDDVSLFAPQSAATPSPAPVETPLTAEFASDESDDESATRESPDDWFGAFDDVATADDEPPSPAPAEVDDPIHDVIDDRVTEPVDDETTQDPPEARLDPLAQTREPSPTPHGSLPGFREVIDRRNDDAEARPEPAPAPTTPEPAPPVAPESLISTEELTLGAFADDDADDGVAGIPATPPVVALDAWDRSHDDIVPLGRSDNEASSRSSRRRRKTGTDSAVAALLATDAPGAGQEAAEPAEDFALAGAEPSLAEAHEPDVPTPEPLDPQSELPSAVAAPTRQRRGLRRGRRRADDELNELTPLTPPEPPDAAGEPESTTPEDTTAADGAATPKKPVRRFFRRRSHDPVPTDLLGTDDDPPPATREDAVADNTATPPSPDRQPSAAFGDREPVPSWPPAERDEPTAEMWFGADETDGVTWPDAPQEAETEPVWPPRAEEAQTEQAPGTSPEDGPPVLSPHTDDAPRRRFGRR